MIAQKGGYATISLLKSKDEIKKYLLKIIALFEQIAEAKLKRVHSDNGTELKSMNSYFKEKGIMHTMSIKYTPESNGFVERFNRTLLDKAHSIIIHASMPIKFW